jgi:hypothetical protein
MARRLHERDAGHTNRLPIDVPLVAACMALPLVLVAAHVPSHLLLPGVALLAFSLAAIAAAGGWLLRAERGGDQVTIFDLAGACVLIGIAAGVFSEPNQVSQFFGAAMTAP